MPFFAPGFGFVGMLTRWFTGVKTLYIVDNVKPHEKRLGDRFFTRWAFRWVDGFVVQSEVVKKDLEDWFPASRHRIVSYVPHPVYDCYGDIELSRESARDQLTVDKQATVLLFFGLVREYKGLDTLLKAMPAILQNMGNGVQLLVAGEFYESEAKYRELIQRLDIEANVRLVNQYVPNEEVGRYFKAADLLVLPYKSATQSGVIQVAKHFKLPVLSTKVGGLPEVILDGQNGLLVEPNDPQALAEGVSRFFKSGLKDVIHQHLQIDVVDDSWDKMLKALESMVIGPVRK
ncbi:glycosyltransferase [bacterium]|nr:glycosyltransferase [bacterium]